MQRISDPYHVLGVGRDATSAEVKAAHRRLAKRLHPDGPQADPNAFLSVQDAYELLSDPLRRTEWDRTHAPGPVRAGESPRSGGRATRARATERPSRPAAGPASRPPVHRDTDHAARAGATTPGAASADSAGPRPRPHTARPLDAAAGPDPDPFSRSSGAAWSSASRAFFRRASADMPSGAAHPNTPRWTTPLGGTPPPRYEVPRQRPPAG
ncbi:MAG: J domain-containing protein, partial [Candidatus Limnocylindrales bacterium]